MPVTDEPKSIARREAELLLYAAPDGTVKVRVLFQVPAINKHLANIFETGELSREAAVSKAARWILDDFAPATKPSPERPLRRCDSAWPLVHTRARGQHPGALP